MPSLLEDISVIGVLIEIVGATLSTVTTVVSVSPASELTPPLFVDVPASMLICVMVPLPPVTLIVMVGVVVVPSVTLTVYVTVPVVVTFISPVVRFMVSALV